MRPGAGRGRNAGALINGKTNIVSSSWIEFANIAPKSSTVPDVPCPVRGNQMGTLRSHSILGYLNRSGSGGGKASNLADACRILCEPGSSPGIDRDAIRIAIWRRDRIFYQRLSLWIEEADIIRAKLGEPEVSACINSQIIGRAPPLQVPLLPALVMRNILTQRVTGGLREPDIPIPIYNHKEWV